ncbi:ATP-binding protein [Streptomyces kanasensis]|uniref:ATP-binding protein n=1 Tax=Streptomyces kanasensis TaxID=936756 RepID=UPI0036F5A30C
MTGHLSPAAPAAAIGSSGFAVCFLPDDCRVRQMRRITAAYLRSRGLLPVLHTAQLVVSELVTNAIRHGRGEVGLTVAAGADGLRIEVSDDNPAPARLRPADEADECGRGLLLVDALATTWGVSPDGHTTRAVLPLPFGRP